MQIHKQIGERWIKPIVLHAAKTTGTIGLALGGTLGAIYASKHVSAILDTAFGGLNTRSNPLVEGTELALGVGLVYLTSMGYNLLRGRSNKPNVVLGTMAVVGTDAVYNFVPSVSRTMEGMLTAQDPLQHGITLTNPEIGAALVFTGLGLGLVYKGLEALLRE